MYLAELTKTTIADDHLADILKELNVVFSARVIDELCRRSMSPKDRMVASTGAFMATTSTALPDDVKQQVTTHIDGVLERYLVDESIIDRLDNPDPTLETRRQVLLNSLARVYCRKARRSNWRANAS